MTTFLTFQLYGPMASWGEVAVGEERDTESVPTRSAVLGLCAAAMGIPRDAEDDLLALEKGLGFAVAVVESGSLLRDYHSIESPAGKRARDLPSRRKELEYYNTGTTLSKRHYRTDAYYIVGIWSRDDDASLLNKLSAALERPRFSLFLGRKCCPLALPLGPRVEQHESLANALGAYPIDSSFRRSARSSAPEIRVTWDANADVETGFDALQTSTRWDRLVSRDRWQFGKREEALAMTKLPFQERR